MRRKNEGILSASACSSSGLCFGRSSLRTGSARLQKKQTWQEKTCNLLVDMEKEGVAAGTVTGCVA